MFASDRSSLRSALSLPPELFVELRVLKKVLCEDKGVRAQVFKIYFSPLAKQLPQFADINDNILAPSTIASNGAVATGHQAWRMNLSKLRRGNHCDRLRESIRNFGRQHTHMRKQQPGLLRRHLRKKATYLFILKVIRHSMSHCRDADQSKRIELLYSKVINNNFSNKSGLTLFIRSTKEYWQHPDSKCDASSSKRGDGRCPTSCLRGPQQRHAKDQRRPCPPDAQAKCGNNDGAL